MLDVVRSRSTVVLVILTNKSVWLESWSRSELTKQRTDQPNVSRCSSKIFVSRGQPYASLTFECRRSFKQAVGEWPMLSSVASEVPSLESGQQGSSDGDPHSRKQWQ